MTETKRSSSLVLLHLFSSRGEKSPRLVQISLPSSSSHSGEGLGARTMCKDDDNGGGGGGVEGGENFLTQAYYSGTLEMMKGRPQSLQLTKYPFLAVWVC